MEAAPSLARAPGTDSSLPLPLRAFSLSWRVPPRPLLAVETVLCPSRGSRSAPPQPASAPPRPARPSVLTPSLGRHCPQTPLLASLAHIHTAAAPKGLRVHPTHTGFYPAQPPPCLIWACPPPRRLVGVPAPPTESPCAALEEQRGCSPWDRVAEGGGGRRGRPCKYAVSGPARPAGEACHKSWRAPRFPRPVSSVVSAGRCPGDGAGGNRLEQHFRDARRDAISSGRLHPPSASLPGAPPLTPGR